ncbi:hypothetical protein CEXT_344991 [Caerostris extrusa]|uniref:Uncharacterized protein n=1 Tax=Caerostris extrusa TaxID=172846 RepID=A0AAV4PB08_CAEEX|nr:hypothetical protein CEXT_344991 [Caerostris extrusa]
MQNCEMQCFQDTEYDAMAIVRKSDRREENSGFASDLNCTSINAKYHRNPLTERADFNSSAFVNRTSTLKSSNFYQSIDQERHWDVNSTAGTDVRYASNNAVQNENSDYFNSSQGVLFPATQHFENSDRTSGVENLAMAFFTEADTNALNPVEQLSTNNSAWVQYDPNLSFYNQLPPNSQGLEDPSNYITLYDPTK